MNETIKRTEKVIIDKPYGQVVIKTRDVDLIKEDLELERFIEKCEVTYYGSSDDVRAIKVSYKYIDENGNKKKIGMKIELNEIDACESLSDVISRITRKIYEQSKAIGVNI